MKRNYKFKSMSEIELLELNYPGIINNDPKVNEAARRLVKLRLEHARRCLAIVTRAKEGSVVANALTEAKNKVAELEKWLSQNPAI